MKAVGFLTIVFVLPTDVETSIFDGPCRAGDFDLPGLWGAGVISAGEVT